MLSLSNLSLHRVVCNYVSGPNSTGYPIRPTIMWCMCPRAPPTMPATPPKKSKDFEEDPLGFLTPKLALDILRGVYSALRCQGCDTFLFPPVPLCVAGHSLCVECGVDERCPLCQRPLLATARNVALEDAARAALVPCRNKAEGCDVVLPPGDARRHALTCPRRPFLCPKLDPMCHWQGRAQTLHDHVLAQHPLHVTRGSELELTLAGPLGLRENFGVLICCGDRFLARVRVHPFREEVLAAVLYLGNLRPASDFAYDASLELASDSDAVAVANADAEQRVRDAGIRRRLSFRVGQRLPVHDAGHNLDRVMEAGDCFRAPIEEVNFRKHDVHRVRIRIEENA